MTQQPPHKRSRAKLLIAGLLASTVLSIAATSNTVSAAKPVDDVTSMMSSGVRW
jgi:hypothetical protein